MRIVNHTADPDAALREAWGDLFEKGKIRIDWSKTRGGIATFVSGRMEGELHDSVEDAVDWLNRVGVSSDRIPTVTLS
jgi:hypothetical protein